MALLLFSALLWTIAGGPQLPTANRCVACHLSDVQTAAAAARVQIWSDSRHADVAVPCNACHGGDPHARTLRLAHVGVLPPYDRESSVHYSKVSTTCGRCHPAEATAYARSVHAVRTSPIVSTAPVCTSCHAGMSARVPDGTELERRCRTCHPGSGSAGDRAALVRTQVDALRTLRAGWLRAEQRLQDSQDPGLPRRAAGLERRADDACRDAFVALHTMDFARSAAAIDEARRQLTALTDELDRR